MSPKQALHYGTRGSGPLPLHLGVRKAGRSQGSGCPSVTLSLGSCVSG